MTDNRESNFVSAVIYVHNDAQKIGGFLETIYSVLSGNFKLFEVICINDGSTDESAGIIRDFAMSKPDPVFSIISMSIYQGVELSMNAGVDLAIGDFVFEFDSPDTDFPEDTIMTVYRHSLEGYDIVSASPAKMTRRSSRLFYRIFNTHSGFGYPLRTESFRLLSRRAINRVHSLSATIPYRKAMYASSGLKIDSIPYPPKTASSLKQEKQVKEIRKSVAIDSLILFTELAYKFSILLTFIMVAFTLGVGLYTVVIFFGHSKPVAGWTTTMLFLSAAFFGVFLVLAIIIKYLSTMMNLIFKKQKYLIESVEKINR